MMKLIRLPSGGAKPVMKRKRVCMLSLAISACALAAPAWSQNDQAAELAKKLSNPLASLISMPLQYNYDTTTSTAGRTMALRSAG
jgi:hypothetical protein